MTISAAYNAYLINEASNPARREAEVFSLSGAVLTEVLNDKESLRFSVKVGDPLIARITLSQSQMQIVRNGTIIWWGIITNESAENGVITYLAQDFSWLFTKRYVAPLNRTPIYTTRFQLAGSAQYYHYAPTTFGSAANSAFAIFSGSNGITATYNGSTITDQQWKVSLDTDGNEVWYDSGTSAWKGRTFTGYWFQSDPDIPGTVTIDPPKNPDLYWVDSVAYPLKTDADNVPITPFPGAGTDVLFVNYGTSKPDVANTLPTADTRIGGRFWRRWVLSNSTSYPKDIHAVVYVRLNTKDFAMDPFSSIIGTMASPKTFSIFDKSTWSVTPGERVLVQFGIGSTTYDESSSNSFGLAALDWKTRATVNTDGLPSGQWVRLVLTATLPANSTDVNLILQFHAATPPGYCIGGVDLMLDDGLFYTDTEQGTIVANILSYIQSASAGWSSLNIGTIIPTTGENRSKVYLYSDYQTAYDALYEYTTLLGGFDFGWTFSRVGSTTSKTFRAWYAAPAPGTAIGTAVGRGTIKSQTLTHGAEILDYSIVGDGTQLSDVVGVYEPTTDAVQGAARDLAVVSSTPTGRWQLATIYEGTPGNNVLTMQSQAQRGFNRYSNAAFALDLTLNPQYTDMIFGLSLGDVFFVSIPELSIYNVQYRLMGRTTKLDDDTVTITVQQYYGV